MNICIEQKAREKVNHNCITLVAIFAHLKLSKEERKEKKDLISAITTNYLMRKYADLKDIIKWKKLFLELITFAITLSLRIYYVIKFIDDEGYQIIELMCLLLTIFEYLIIHFLLACSLNKFR